MPVVTVRTREASDSDLAAVVDLWDELRESGGRLGPFGPPASTSAVRDRLAALGSDDAHRVILAEIEAEIVGLAVLSRLPITPISDVESIQISFMHVRNDRRRRGVGRAIVESAMAFANDVGADYVTVGVFPGSRDTNRYFARLGFSPLVVRRAIATSLLQRKLSGDDGVRDVLTRRRRGRQLREG
ncbi:MAG TPA: GNAT family N-acetyltransferase [Actinomycetes bacterium]|nr:GNAT family N-acetyltransferase [Actinomycetes bacterium]